MTDPARWIDDPATSSHLRVALQQYPRPSAMPVEALQALGVALEAQPSATSSAVPNSTVPSSASAAPSTSIGAAVLGKAGLVAIAIGLGGAGWLTLSTRTEHAAPVATKALVVASPPPNAAPAADRGLQDRSAENAPTTRNASETTPRKPEAAAARGVPTGAANVKSEPGSLARPIENAQPDTSQLQREATLLEVSRRLLPTDPRRALEQTALYRQRFPRPLLGFERDLIEMDALCRLGNTAKGEHIANSLLQAQPAGPYAERARAILARANRDRAREEVKEHSGRDNQ